MKSKLAFVRQPDSIPRKTAFSLRCFATILLRLPPKTEAHSTPLQGGEQNRIRFQTVHQEQSCLAVFLFGGDAYAMSKQRIEDCYFEHNSTIFSEMLGEDEEYLRLKKAKRAAEEALQSVISKEAWNQYLALDEICNELECARYKAMYLAGAADYEKLSK